MKRQNDEKTKRREDELKTQNTMERLNNMTMNDLKELLRAAGLATIGNKSDLILRLSQLGTNEIDKVSEI